MNYTANEYDKGVRLDTLVAKILNTSRSSAAKLIEDEGVSVNGKAAQKRYEVKENDLIEIIMPEPKECEARAENIPLDIIYEDDDVLVINKKSGMVVHPAPGNYEGTLVNALLYYLKDNLSTIGGVLRPGIVHRIDKDTSGLLVVAKNDDAHRFLTEQLAEHGVTREYHALVTGGFKEDCGVVDAPIGRHPVDRKKMAVIKNGEHSAKEAVTDYKVLESFGNISYLKLNLKTGRTHQIRVHMSYLGHPLLGDTTYGGGKSRFEKLHAKYISGQVLHAKRLSFIHPKTKEKVSFECPLPEDFETLLRILREENN